MSWFGEFLWCLGAAVLLSIGGCITVHLLWRRRHSALRQEITRFSEDLLQMTELQMDFYRRVCRDLNDIEEKVLDLSVPSSDTPLPLERRHQVLTLARKGMSLEEIARRLNMPQGEAELILSLRKYTDVKKPPQPERGVPKGYAHSSM
jgi:hypothetical protein